jgi:transposase
MKHEKRFKLAAVRRYLRGGIVYRDLANELGISKSALQRWVAWFHKHGGFIERKPAHAYAPEFKLSVLQHMWENHLSHSQTSLHFDIPDHTSVGNWARLYATGGVNALMQSQKDDSASMTIPTTKPETPSTGADQSQKQLLKEIEQLRMENAYLKKLQALVASQGSKPSGKKPK